jgi:hypothetical protein
MADEDRKLIQNLIAAINGLSASIAQMSRSITIYDPQYRPPGGRSISVVLGRSGGTGGYGGGV